MAPGRSSTPGPLARATAVRLIVAAALVPVAAPPDAAVVAVAPPAVVAGEPYSPPDESAAAVVVGAALVVGVAAAVVAVLDLIPVAGSVTAGIIASLVAFTVSPTVGWLTVGFFVLYRFLEDYLIFPGVVGRVVKVPALLTLVAVLLGGALYGIIGVLIAIPIAAAVHLLLHEIVFPRLDAVEAAPG